MDVKEAILKRRSIREFIQNPISDDMIRELLESAMAAPSACNKRPWEFYVVKSKQQKVRKIRPAREFKVAKSAPMECVIVGMRTEEAKVVVDRYINDCILANRHQGFIVHGIGSGVLKKMINRYLNEHPGVKSVKAAEHSQGGPAVTVVSFQ